MCAQISNLPITEMLRKSFGEMH